MQKGVRMKKKNKILLLIVLSVMIAGCKKAENKNSIDKPPNLGSSEKGRYTESNISLPENLDDHAVIQLTGKDGLPFLYVFSGSEQTTIAGYRMDKDGTWTEDTPEWLKNVSIPSVPNYQDMVFEDSRKNQYLYYTVIEDNHYKGSLLSSNGGNGATPLSPEGWDKKPEENGGYPAPERIAVLENGTLVTLDAYTESTNTPAVNFYNSETLDTEYSITETQYAKTILFANGRSLILGEEKGGKITSIDVYDTMNGYGKTSYPIQSALDGSAYVDVNGNEDILLCNPDGIHILEQGTSTWQTIVDGTITSLSMKTLRISGFTAGENGDCYVLYHSESGYSLMGYHYDASVNSVPATEITVFSLTENTAIQQAASVFCRYHPDVKVNFAAAMTYEEFMKADNSLKRDYIRALNTELLAGNGPDILILDGLPTDSFLEKGVLADITDVIRPLTDSGELLPNIVNAYWKNEKIYYVPTHYNLPFLFGKKTGITELSAIDGMADYASAHRDEQLFDNITLNDFITLFSPYLSDKIIVNGKPDRAKLVSVLNELREIADNCIIIEENGKESEDRTDISSLVKGSPMCLVPLNGFTNSTLPLGIAEYVNGSYVPFEASFIPSCELGINAASNQIELCKKFLTLALSEEIGSIDFYNGFPVNKKALETISKNDRSNFVFGTKIEKEDGTYTNIILEPLNEEQLETLINACTSVSKRASSNEQIESALLEETEEFFKGNLTAEETANRIMEKVSLYLAE